MLLSVIIPIYNTEKYLSRCLDSVLNQSYSNLEVILINDGSTDSSLHICHEYEEKDRRIRVFSQENSGQSVARNVGLDAASGDLISFIDSDDYIEQTTFQEAIDVLLSHDRCDIVQFPTFHERKHDTPELVAPKEGAIYNTQDLLEACLLRHKISWIVCDKIIRKPLLSNLRFLEGIRYEDNLMLFQLLIRSKGLCFSTSGYYYYCWNTQSTTHSSTPQPRLWDDMIDIHKRIHKLVSQTHPKSSAEAMILYIIAQDMYTSYRSHKWKRNSVSDSGLELFRHVRIANFIYAKELSLRKRLKILWMRIWAALVHLSR